MSIEIDKLNNELNEVTQQVNLLNEERFTFQSKLTRINTSLKEKGLPNKLYKKYAEARIEYANSIQENLKHYRVLKKRQKEIGREVFKLEDEVVVPENKESVKVKLLELKDKYFEFYTDKSRIASMRKMSSDFIIELDKIIKTI